MSADLERDAIVYSHSENFVRLCASCWRNPDVNHRHEYEVDKHVVTGRIAAPADTDVRELLRQIDHAMAEREPCRSTYRIFARPPASSSARPSKDVGSG